MSDASLDGLTRFDLLTALKRKKISSPDDACQCSLLTLLTKPSFPTEKVACHRNAFYFFAKMFTLKLITRSQS